MSAAHVVFIGKKTFKNLRSYRLKRKKSVGTFKFCYCCFVYSSDSLADVLLEVLVLLEVVGEGRLEEEGLGAQVAAELAVLGLRVLGDLEATSKTAIN